MIASSKEHQAKLKRGYLIVNFGGPRSLDEVRPFLTELLCDQDVVRTGLPQWIHSPLFRLIASGRSRRIREEYRHIGSRSPIYEDTMWLSRQLQATLQGPIWTFHRYLPATHAEFLSAAEDMRQLDEIVVFPLFPQFSYATTGSAARWMQNHLPSELWRKLRWIRSYPDHPLFIQAYADRIGAWLKENSLNQEEWVALCSFHGIPKSFVKGGDPYDRECQRSFQSLASCFPKMTWHMSYQSKFGPGEWLRPYTNEACHHPHEWDNGRKNILIIPLAFTSDHIETLGEIENMYLPPLREKGYRAERLPALNRSQAWLNGVKGMIEEAQDKFYLTSANQQLVASHCPMPLICPRLGMCACPRNN